MLGAIILAAAVAVSLPVKPFREGSTEVASVMPDLGKGMFGAFTRDNMVQVSSAQLVAGVMAGDARQKGGFPILYVMGIGPGDVRLCISLSSTDGYKADGEVQLTPAAAAAGVVRLALPTVRIERSGLPAAATVALVRVTDKQRSCRARDPVLVSSWGAAAPLAAVSGFVADAGDPRPLEMRAVAAPRGQKCVSAPKPTTMVPGYRRRCPVERPPAQCGVVEFVLQTAADPAALVDSTEEKGRINVRFACPVP